MTNKNKILRIVLLTFFGSLYIYKLYKISEDDFFLDGIILLFIKVVGLLFLTWTIFKDFIEYKQTKKLTAYIPTFIGSFFILTISSLYFYQDIRSNSPTLIRAYYDGDYNGFSVDLKVNGNYIMANGSGLGQSYFYGTYLINDSIITLDKSNIDKVITTDKLVIRTITNIFQQDTIDGDDTTQKDYIIQVDKNWKELNTNFRFRVTVDNRKTKSNFGQQKKNAL